MAGFRVQDHHKWRKGPPRAPHPDRSPSEPAAPRPPTPTIGAPNDPAEERIEAIAERMRALGPLGWPAVAYDSLFGAWRNRGPTFFVVRFLLVALAVGLFVGGVSGEAPVVYKAGAYQSVTPANVVDTYVTERSVHVYPVFVNESRFSHVRAVFDSGHGELHVPDLDEKENVYALQVRLVRKDPSIMPVLLLSQPEESHRSVAPVSDDSVSLRYPPIPLDEAGKWELVVHSSRGIGHVEMHLSVAEAPIIATEGPNPAWAQAGAGVAILAVLLGAYTPGAILLRERRDLERREEDEAWRVQAQQERPADADYARVNPRHSGVLAWERPDKEGPDHLAELPGRGWVIRMD